MRAFCNLISMHGWTKEAAPKALYVSDNDKYAWARARVLQDNGSFNAEIELCDGTVLENQGYMSELGAKSATTRQVRREFAVM